MEPLISVIIPYYKSDKSVKRCIESIHNQKCITAEIIVVVDSKNPDAANDFVEFPYVDVHLGRDGSSVNRNIGMELAKGEYIFFIDADDYLPRDDVFSQMTEDAFTSGADMVMGEYDIYQDETRSDGGRFSFEGERLLTGLEPMRHLIDCKEQLIWRAIWNILYRREFLLSERFDESLIYVEDTVLLARLFAYQPKVYCKQGFVSYAYVVSGPSLSHSISFDKSISEFKAHTAILRIIDENASGLRESYLPSLFSSAIGILTMFALSAPKRYKEVYKELRKEYLSYGKMPRHLKFSRKQRIMDRLIRINAFWFVNRIRRMNRR